MHKFRKLVAAVILGAIILIAVAPAAAKVTVVFLAEGDPSQWGVDGDPSQWGVFSHGGGSGKVSMQDFHFTMAGDPSQWEEADLITRKVNEYEGQHR
jgi:hypothetical protein